MLRQHCLVLKPLALVETENGLLLLFIVSIFSRPVTCYHRRKEEKGRIGDKRSRTTTRCVQMLLGHFYRKANAVWCWRKRKQCETIEMMKRESDPSSSFSLALSAETYLEQNLSRGFVGERRFVLQNSFSVRFLPVYPECILSYETWRCLGHGEPASREHTLDAYPCDSNASRLFSVLGCLVPRGKNILFIFPSPLTPGQEMVEVFRLGSRCIVCAFHTIRDSGTNFPSRSVCARRQPLVSHVRASSCPGTHDVPSCSWAQLVD